MKAVNKFKSLLWRRRPELMTGILGQDVRIVQPPLQLDSKEDRPLNRTQSFDLDNRRPVEGALVSEGVHREIEPRDTDEPVPLLHRMDLAVSIKSPALTNTNDQLMPHHKRQHSMDSAHPMPHLDTRRTQTFGERGHAHDPMDEEPLWLGIGPGEDIDVPPETPICAESPTAADFNIYDIAYEREVERIREAQGYQATVYLTRRVDSKKAYEADAHMIDAPKESEVAGKPHAGWESLLDEAREKGQHITSPTEDKQNHGHNLLGLAAQAGASAKPAGEEAMNRGQQLTYKGGSTMMDIVKKAMGRTSTEADSNQT
jgi:[calcium/calmodulin-dependent protein kinase] kinase